jgi:hypothetical protein
VTVRTPVLRALVLVLVVVPLFAACSNTNNRGPDLIAAVTSVGGATTGPTGASVPDPDPLDGAERRFYFRDDVTPVANAIRNRAGSPTDTINRDGVVHYLYRSGTVIIADVGGTTGVGLFDNNRARRNRPALMNSAGWNRHVNSFGSSGSSGNNFRGGGSGSGK